MPRKSPHQDKTGRLATVTLDEASLGSTNDDVEHERRVAIYDLLEDNQFQPIDHQGGPYTLQLGISGNRLVFDIRLTDGSPGASAMPARFSSAHIPRKRLAITSPVPTTCCRRRGRRAFRRVSAYSIS